MRVPEQLVALAPVRKGRERKRERKRGIEFVITEGALPLER